MKKVTPEEMVECVEGHIEAWGVANAKYDPDAKEDIRILRATAAFIRKHAKANTSETPEKD